MKILIVVHYFMPHIGGMEAVALQQARSLVRDGHEVTVITARYDRRSPSKEKYEGICIVRLAAWNFIEKKFGVTFPIVSPFALLKFIKLAQQHDVVHIHDVFYMTSHMACFASLLMRRKYYLTQHVALVDHPSFLVMSVQKIVYKLFGDSIFKKATKIISYNPNVTSFLIQRGVDSNKIFEHFNGIDTDYFSPISPNKIKELRAKYGYSDTKKIILFVGRLVPKKGYDIVAQVASDEFHTLIVGGGDESTTYRKNESIRYYGSARGDELRDLYRMCDVFVFPAVGEMFTLVMQEAMSCGLPVIVAENPGYNKYNVDDVLIFSKRTSRSLKSTILQLLQEKEKLNNYTKQTRKFALNNFSWDENYEKEKKMYLESAA